MRMMNEMMSADLTSPTTSDRLLAALAHAGGLLPGVGIVAPPLVWAARRERSPYVRGQSLQALAYQTCQAVAVVLFVLLWLIAFVITLGPLVRRLINQLHPNDAVLTPFTGLGVAFAVFWGLLLLPALIGGVAALLGRDFRYPFFGRKLTELIASEAGEDRLVAALGHAAVFINLTGLVVPLTAWLVGRQRSDWLHFQMLQALIFQGVFLVISLPLGVFMVLMGLLPLPLMASINTQSQATAVVTAVLIALLVLLAVLGVLLVVALFQMLGAVAALRTLQGRDYRYPLIGRWVENYLKKNRQGAAAPIA